MCSDYHIVKLGLYNYYEKGKRQLDLILSSVKHTHSSLTKSVFSFFSHILLCNVLTVILRPNFEEPLDTAKQLDEKDITIYFEPGFDGNKQWLLDSPILENRILGENAIIADDWDHFDYITKHYVIGAGTHAQMEAHLAPYELSMGRWYRSKEMVSGMNPIGGYLTNKKWHLNEVISTKY